jgi:hypothetical protein
LSQQKPLISLRPLKRLIRLAFWLTLSFFVIFGIISLSLRTQAAQTFVVQKLAEWVSDRLGFRCTIGGFYLDWVDFARITKVRIEDRSGKPLIVVGVLKVNLKLKALLERNIHLDAVEAKNGLVMIRVDRKTGRKNIVEFIDAIQKLVDDGDTTRSPNPPRFSIDKVKLEAMAFAYMDETEPSLPNQFDYYHFKLAGIQGQVSNFWQRRDTIGLNVDSLSAYDVATRLEVKNLRAGFRYTKNDMVLSRLHARIGESTIADSLVFKYNSPDDFSDFNQKVEMSANLSNSVVSTQDLSLFAPALKNWFETYEVSGKFNGTVDDFRLNRFRLRAGKNSFLAGNLSMKGLPEVDETYTDLRIKSSFINPEDLRFYTGNAAADVLTSFGVMDVTGSFTGFFRNFVTKGNIKTHHGFVQADMQMELPWDTLALPRYRGNIKTNNFDLGKITGQSAYVQNIDIDGNFEGEGFDLNRAKIDLNASIPRIGILGYNYSNLKTKGHFEKRKYAGFLDIHDPHLIFNVSGKLDLTKRQEIVDLEALIAKANFKPLKLTDYPLDISSEIGMHFKGFDFDNFLGSIFLKNFRILYKDERLDLNEVSLESHIEKGVKKLNFKSPLATASLEGSFRYRKFLEDSRDLIGEYIRLIKNKTNYNLNDYITQRRKNAVDYKINADINILNPNPLLDLIDQPVAVSENTRINVQMQFGKTEMVMINTHIDSIRFKDYAMYQTDVDLSSVKTLERADVLAELYVYSQEQNWNSQVQTERLMVDWVWEDEKIKFKLLANEQKTTNQARIFGSVHLHPQTTEVQLENSYLSLMDRIWKINNQNIIEIADSGTVRFENVELENENQNLSVRGFLTGNPKDTLEIRASNFEIKTLQPMTKQDIMGSVNARILVTKLSESPLYEGFLDIDSLRYNQFLIGNFSGKADWNQSQKHLDIMGTLSRENQKVVMLKGFYDPEEASPLYIRAGVNRLNIQFLNIFIGNYVSNLRGFGSGDLLIRGGLSKPVITGNLQVSEGQVKINYLNTTYFFNHQVTFLPNEINADGIVLLDENGQSASVVRAALNHQNFDRFYVRLEGRLRQFMVFNRIQQPGEIYYGTALCSGDLFIQGSFDDISIRANAVTSKGTRIFIPLEGSGKEDIKEEFISFQTKKSREVQQKVDTVARVKLSGIKMEFNLDVTEDAYGEIIFDKKAGDIIRANGAGKIKMIIDTKGEFSVIGQYVIKKGDYHFTTYNLVNKDFDIKPGSTITWNGPVLEGMMDILAEYNLTASLAPLAANDPQIQERPESKRRYPVVVRMRLTEQLLKPDIGLGLEIRDYPRNSDLNYYVQAFQSRISTDEQELNRQVFSLMIFRMFAPMGDFVQTSSISYSSFSDLVSNQLSSWLSQFDENLEVAIDLNGLSGSALSNFQLRFSYTLLEGRLRLTRDGGFTNAQNQTSALSIAGDWTLEYMLSKDGFFRVKMFHKINQNLILSGLNNNNTTQGASLLYTQSFNRLSELLPKKKKKKSEDRKPVKDSLPPPKQEEVTGGNPKWPETR